MHCIRHLCRPARPFRPLRQLLKALPFFGVLIFLQAAVLFTAFPAEARDWEHPGFETGHISTLYTIRNGMPYSEVNTMAQTEDGFLYFGSYGGLVQYDGRGFHRIEGISSVVSLCADPDGSLWIGTNDMGLVCKKPGDEYLFYGKEAGFRSLSIRAIQPDGKGNLFFATTSGIFYRPGTAVSGAAAEDAPDTPDAPGTADTADTADTVIPVDDVRIEGTYISDITAAADGVLYGVTVDGDVFSIENFEVEKYITAAQAGAGITCVCPDPSEKGRVYLGTEGEYILYGDLKKDPASFRKIEMPGLSGVNMLSLIDGKLWICTNGGIAYMDDEEGFKILSLTPLPMVGGVLKDYEGNLWFYSYRNGVLKVSRSIFTDVSLMTDMKDRVVTTTWMKDDLLYTGTDTGLLVFRGDGQRAETPVSELLKDARIRAIKEDRKGNLWFCTFSEHGLVCLHPDGTYRCFNQKSGMVSDYSRTIFERSDGTMAAAFTGGIHIIQDEKVVRTFGSRQGLPNSVILAITEDSEGRLLFGTNGDGIYMLEGAKISRMKISDDLDSQIILRVKRDEKRDCFWIATSREVAALKDGTIRKAENFPLSDMGSGCYDILIPDNKSVWMTGGAGVYAADGDELLSGHVSDYRFYNTGNGLPHITTANSRNYVSPKGIAYVSGVDGITGIDLNNLDRLRGRAKLAIPWIDADETRIYTRPGEKVVLPSDTRRIVIHSYVLSYALGDPVVSVNLEGFDEKPTITTKTNLYPKTYTNLPGGTYVFRLAPVNAGGVQTDGVSITIVKKKAFYEQVWFWLLCCLVFTGAMILLVNRLLARQARRLDKKRDEERIASELSMAAGIQASALPGTFPAFPDRKDFDIYASMTPAREVGGDFYDFFLVDEDHLAMVIADVSDKGVPAALYMMSAKISINDYTMTGKEPADVLTAVNDVLTRNPQDMFVTVWVGVLDLKTGVLTAANAGHEYPILLSPGGSFEIVKDRHGIVLGGMEGVWYRQYELKLEPGSKLFLYTDGVPEASNKDKKFFGLERTLEALNRKKEGTPEELIASVSDAVREFADGAPPFDDMTMLCLSYAGPEEAEQV